MSVMERRYGPGSEHVQHPTSANIINPIRQDMLLPAMSASGTPFSGRP